VPSPATLPPLTVNIPFTFISALPFNVVATPEIVKLENVAPPLIVRVPPFREKLCVVNRLLTVVVPLKSIAPPVTAPTSSARTGNTPVLQLPGVNQSVLIAPVHKML